MKKILAAIILAALSVPINAQDISVLPIQNIGVLKAYAKDMASSGKIQIFSPAVISPDQSATISAVAKSGGADAVLGALASQQFDFNVARADAPAYLYAALYNKSGLLLFRGNTQTRFTSFKGDAVWLENADTRLDLAEQVPLFIPGIASARAVVTDKSGQTIGDLSLKVEGEYIVYSTNLVSRTGTIIFDTRGPDGKVTSHVADMATGVVTPPVRANGFVGVGIAGDYDFGNNPQNISLFGVPDLRGAVVHFTAPDRVNALRTKVGGQSASGEAPIGLIARFRSDPNSLWSNWAFGGFPPGFDGTWTFGGGGEWEVVYIMSPQDLEGIPLLPPDYYGGKGF